VFQMSKYPQIQAYYF